jgi:hypothetical protein
MFGYSFPWNGRPWHTCIYSDSCLSIIVRSSFAGSNVRLCRTDSIKEPAWTRWNYSGYHLLTAQTLKANLLKCFHTRSPEHAPPLLSKEPWNGLPTKRFLDPSSSFGSIFCQVLDYGCKICRRNYFCHSAISRSVFDLILAPPPQWWQWWQCMLVVTVVTVSDSGAGGAMRDSGDSGDSDDCHRCRCHHSHYCWNCHHSHCTAVTTTVAIAVSPLRRTTAVTTPVTSPPRSPLSDHRWTSPPSPHPRCHLTLAVTSPSLSPRYLTTFHCHHGRVTTTVTTVATVPTVICHHRWPVPCRCCHHGRLSPCYQISLNPRFSILSLEKMLVISVQKARCTKSHCSMFWKFSRTCSESFKSLRKRFRIDFSSERDLNHKNRLHADWYFCQQKSFDFRGEMNMTKREFPQGSSRIFGICGINQRLSLITHNLFLIGEETKRKKRYEIPWKFHLGVKNNFRNVIRLSGWKIVRINGLFW